MGCFSVLTATISQAASFSLLSGESDCLLTNQVQIHYRSYVGHIFRISINNWYMITCAPLSCVVLNSVSSELMILRCAKAKPVTPKMPYSFQKFTAVTVRENTVSYNCTGSRLCVTKQKTLSNIIQLKSDHSAPLHTDYQGSQNNKSWLMPYTCCNYRNNQYGNG